MVKLESRENSGLRGLFRKMEQLFSRVDIAGKRETGSTGSNDQIIPGGWPWLLISSVRLLPPFLTIFHSSTTSFLSPGLSERIPLFCCTTSELRG